MRLASGEPAIGAQVRLFDLSDLRAAPIQATADEAGYFVLPLEGASAVPERFELGPNYPNPFNPSTIIPFQLSASMRVRLEVFNASSSERNAQTADGFTVLMAAALGGNVEVVRFLWDRSTAFRRNDQTADGDTALSLAQKEGRQEVVDFLRSVGANE